MSNLYLQGDYREDPSARCEMPTWLGRCYAMGKAMWISDLQSSYSLDKTTYGNDSSGMKHNFLFSGSNNTLIKLSLQ